VPIAVDAHYSRREAARFLPAASAELGKACATAARAAPDGSKVLKRPRQSVKP
jgi:hypothetical protein